MSRKQVSIVIPTFNRADFVGRAIDSCLAQTHPIEVIVVNHGSTDHTDSVVAKFGDRVTYIRREHDFGPHFCWLEGVLHASGEFVHLQFDDDWIEPTFVEACMGLMTEETGFAFSAAKVFSEAEEKYISTLFDGWLPSSGSYSLQHIEHEIVGSMISPAAAVHRKQILLDALYQGRLPLDPAAYHGVGPDCFVSLLAMLRYPKVGFVKDTLAIFSSHPGSITMDAASNPEKGEALALSYDHVKRFYRELKLLRILRNPWFKKPLGWTRRLLKIP